MKYSLINITRGLSPDLRAIVGDFSTPLAQSQLLGPLSAAVLGSSPLACQGLPTAEVQQPLACYGCSQRNSMNVSNLVANHMKCLTAANEK